MSELNKITIDGIGYDLPSGGGEGTTVIPNPEDEATDSLHKIKIGEDTYKIEKVPMFTGTKQEYEEALSKGEIPEGCIVNITDDFTPGGGTDHFAQKAIADNWQGKGYNLIPFPYERMQGTHSGVTWKTNTDGTVVLSGTSTTVGTGNYIVLHNYRPISELGEVEDSIRLIDVLKENEYYSALYFYNSAKEEVGSHSSISKTPRKITSDIQYYRLYIVIKNAHNVDNFISKPLAVKVADDGTYPTEYQRYAKGNVELTECINTISDAYNQSATYAQGEFCIYNNTLWKSKVNNNTGNTPTEGSYWTATNVGNEIIDNKIVPQYIYQGIAFEGGSEITNSGITFVAPYDCWVNLEIRIPANGIVAVYIDNLRVWRWYAREMSSDNSTRQAQAIFDTGMIYIPKGKVLKVKKDSDGNSAYIEHSPIFI